MESSGSGRSNPAADAESVIALAKQDTWFKARFNWSEIFEDLNDYSLRLLILSIWNYAKDGTEPDLLPPELKLPWKLIKGEIEQDLFFRECGKRGGNPTLKDTATTTGFKGGSRGVQPGVEPGLSRIDKNREEKIREEKKREENKKRGEENIDTGISEGNPKASGGGQCVQRFKPPTVEEVRQYCRERNNTIDPEEFVDYYQARGWELKKGQKMKDWQASVRYWEKNQKGGQNGTKRYDRAVDIPGQCDFYGDL